MRLGPSPKLRFSQLSWGTRDSPNSTALSPQSVLDRIGIELLAIQNIPAAPSIIIPMAAVKPFPCMSTMVAAALLLLMVRLVVLKDELELECAEMAGETDIVELVAVAAEPPLLVVEVVVLVSVVDEESSEDPETAPPKQPVGTPAQKKMTVPQVCPNLQDHVSPL